MKTIETWEAIKELSEIPEKEFINDKGQKLTVDKYDGIVCINKNGKEGRFFVNDQWQEVKQPVDFMTAFNALREGRKNIYVKTKKYTKWYSEDAEETHYFNEDDINLGKWYIED